MSSPYTIVSGDTLVRIAAKHGFKSWREIYYHDDNRAFRLKRPNPDRIFPGDVILIPDGASTATPPKDGDFIGFENDEQIALVKADIARALIMLGVVNRRLRVIAGIGPSGTLLVTPRTVEYYDTKLKVRNVFKTNTFTEDDLPIPDAMMTQLRLVHQGLQMPTPPDLADVPGHSLQFSSLLQRFGRLQGGLRERFPKEFYTKPTFKGSPIGFFAAFVDRSNLADATVRFTRFYFKREFVDADARSVTIAHERAHTLFRTGGHPGTGDNPFCVAPHLGDAKVTRFQQAFDNPYCYEWLMYAMQRNYNPRKHRGRECGT